MVVSYYSMFLSSVPVFRSSFHPFGVFHLLYHSFIVFGVSSIYFRSPRNIMGAPHIFLGFSIPVSYPIPYQYDMIHHDISPSLEAYVRASHPGPRPHDIDTVQPENTSSHLSQSGLVSWSSGSKKYSPVGTKAQPHVGFDFWSEKNPITPFYP